MKMASLLGALAFVAGCGYPLAAGPRPANVSQNEFNQLWYFAARQLDCPAKQLQYEQFAQSRHLFKGCGQQIEMISVRDSSSVTGIYTRAAAANRYAKEVGCAITSTREEQIDTVTRVVDGCGPRITYVFNCSAADCTWVANVAQK